MFAIGTQIWSVDFGSLGTIIASDASAFVLRLQDGREISYPHTSDPAAFEIR